MSRKKCIGLICGFLAFLPVIFDQSLEELSAGKFFIFSYPELALFVASLSSVYGWVLIRQLITKFSMHPLAINAYSMFIGGLMTLAYSSFKEVWSPLPIYTGQEWNFLQSMFYLLLISNIICYNLYAYLLKSYSATFMSFAGFSTPLFVAIFSYILLGETVSISFVCSFFAVFLSLYLFHQEELKSEAKQLEPRSA